MGGRTFNFVPIVNQERFDLCQSKPSLSQQDVFYVGQNFMALDMSPSGQYFTHASTKTDSSEPLLVKLISFVGTAILFFVHAYKISFN